LWPPPELESPRGQAVHVWKGSLELGESKLAEATQFLARDELQRATRFHFPLHRARFIASRGLLRSILGRYLGSDPTEVEFEYSAYGKPRLRKSGPHFNLAHAEDRFIVAFGEKPIGVDIEIRRPMSDIYSLANHVFSPAELAFWKTGQTTDAFLSLWTRKEALLKGIGLGIAYHVKQVSVFFDNEGEIVVPEALASDKWTVRTHFTDDEIWSIAVPFAAPEIAAFSCG